MAGLQTFQPRLEAGRTGDWMAQRWRDVASLGPEADAVGRETWAAATRSGQGVAASRPGDVRALGARVLRGEDTAEGVRIVAQPNVRTAQAPGAALQAARAALPGARRQDDGLAELRRQQADFAKVVHAEGIKNSWMLAPILAPAVAVLGLEAAAALAARTAIPILSRSPPTLPVAAPAAPVATSVTRPVGQARSGLAPSLTNTEKNALRAIARTRYARANGLPAKDMEAQVHHRIALEFAHFAPRADPNRLANLVALERRAHDIATQAWRAFARELAGRAPTQAEVVAQAMKVDRLIESYILRATTPRPQLPPVRGRQP